jgi:uncharacterized protein
MQIIVDADAFPNALKEILFRAAERIRIPLIFVANQYVKIPESNFISSLTVENGPDIADDWISEHVHTGDLVITADIPLADRVVEKGGYALNPRGELYTENNIKQRLSTRNLMEDLRNRGIMPGGPTIFNKKDVQSFSNQLDRFLTKHVKKS